MTIAITTACCDHFVTIAIWRVQRYAKKISILSFRCSQSRI